MTARLGDPVTARSASDHAASYFICWALERRVLATLQCVLQLQQASFHCDCRFRRLEATRLSLLRESSGYVPIGGDVLFGIELRCMAARLAKLSAPGGSESGVYSNAFPTLVCTCHRHRMRATTFPQQW